MRMRAYMHVCVCVCAHSKCTFVYVSVCTERRCSQRPEVAGPPIALLTDGCKLPDVAARNRTRGLCKSSTRS